jgi:hypothetical protein
LLQTGEGTGKAIAKRLKDAVAADPKLQDVHDDPVIAVAVVSAPAHGRSLDALLSAALSREHWSNGDTRGDGGPTRFVH